MANQFPVVLLLVLIYVLSIEGHFSVPKVKGIEPEVIEIPSGGLPLSLLRNKRQQFSNVSHIGVTAKLANDSHNVAVVHWSGYPSENIFVLTKKTRNGLYGPTEESFLWRSTDYGRTFVNETNKFPHDAKAHWYFISKDNNKIIFQDVVNRRLYVTTDEGETYNTYNLTFQPDTIHFSYSNDSHPEYVYFIESATKNLYVSTNLGKTWTSVGSNVGTVSWTYHKEGQDFDEPNVIYFSALDTATGGYRIMRAEHPYRNNSIDIEDFDRGIGEVTHFAVFYEYLFAVKNTSSGSPLFVSYKRNPFAQAHFPLSIEQRHFSVVDASEGEVFIAVYHNENFTNLYISDELGISYSLTLEDVISNGEDAWNTGNAVFDLHVVEGIKGTYIANIEVEDGAYGATVISYDKGAEWVPLTAPTLDHNGVPLNCFPPECSLHLHMDSSASFGYSNILSKETAVGLIMAQGNTGSSLRHAYYQTRVYFSHNGGFSWQELFRYNHVFQFLDHGSIVVAVRKYAYATDVEFSCDEGLTWNTYKIFGDETGEPTQLFIVGMFTEYGERAVHATAFGLEKFPFKEWILVDLDFSQLNISMCNASQYTTWVPTDERLGRRCLLGERVMYEKRISGQCCINGPEYERPINHTTCECAIEDFECDFNFERLNLDSPCVPIRGYDPYAVPKDCPEDATYNVSSGYRRIAGDRCVIDKNKNIENSYFLPQTLPCPIPAPEALFIIQETRNLGAKQPVEFELIQLAGGKLSTNYTWQWGDGSHNFTATGYSNNGNRSHTYNHPGTYTVRVTATNVGGSAVVEKTVTILDFIANVTLSGPENAAVNTLLSYSIQVTTKFGTNYTGPITYTWDFGDSTTSTGATASHAYHRANKYYISYTASNPVGSKANVFTVLIEEIIDHVALIIDPMIAAVNMPVTFSATMQYSDYYGNISYHYVFGDGAAITNNSKNASHAYTAPGVYTARVSLGNLAGVISAVKNVHVQDKISSVTIRSLANASLSTLLAITNQEIILTAVVTSLAGTSYYTPVIYHWNFGDGHTAVSTELSITYSYSTPGSWNVTLQATNNVSSAVFSGRVKVYNAVSQVGIRGPDIVPVGSNVSFLIYVIKDDEVLPSDTVYTWSVISHIAGSTYENKTGRNLANYSRVFPDAGTFEVVVLGVYSTGSFTTSNTIIIRSKIGRIDITVDQVIEVNREAMLYVHLFDTNNITYSESINITFITSKNNTDVSYYERAIRKTPYRLLYKYPDSYTVQVMAMNEVSMMNKSVSVEVVSTNISVVISFNVSTLKSANIDYEDTFWIDTFLVVVDTQITKDLHLEDWRLMAAIISAADDYYDDKYFKVQLDVLPEQDINHTINIASQLIQLVLSDSYNIALPENINLKVSDATMKTTEPVVVHDASTSSSSSSNQLAIELGVGGGVALLVAIVLCAIGIAYYRRKYRRLEVQYSRLTQSDPVHFNVIDDTTCGEPDIPTEKDTDQENDEL